MNARDNGNITPGSFVALFKLKPSEQTLGNVPILESGQGCLLLETPSNIPTVPVDTQIQANVTRAFVYNGVQLESKQIQAIDTCCAGYFCDCQDSKVTREKGCGCYTNKGRQSGVALFYRLKFVCSESFEFTMNDFGSLKFTSLFITGEGKGRFPSSIAATALDEGDANNDHGSVLEDCIDNQIDFINNNGGFTVSGWYKRGSIMDGILSNTTKQSGDNEMTIASSEVQYHAVSIIPTCRDILEHPTFKRNKFNVGVFNGEVDV